MYSTVFQPRFRPAMDNATICVKNPPSQNFFPQDSIISFPTVNRVGLDDETVWLLGRPNAEFAAAVEQRHHVQQSFVITFKAIRGGCVPQGLDELF